MNKKVGFQGEMESTTEKRWEGCQLEAGRMWEETDQVFWKNTDEEVQL